MGRMIRGNSKNARFLAVDTTDIVQKAMEIHQTNPLATDAFGRILTFASMLGANLKGKDVLTCIVNGDGQIKRTLVTANSAGNVKGYMSEVQPGSLEEPVLGEGNIQIIKDFGLKEPYVGVASLTDKGLAYDISSYFYASEQIPTVIAFTVILKNEREVEKAGGYMIQLLPNAEESFLEALERKVVAMKSIDDLFKGGMDLEDIIALVYDDMDTEEHKSVEDYEILEEKEIHYDCDCEKDKFYRAILSLGEQEVTEILKEEGQIQAECHFCGKRYAFTEGDFTKEDFHHEAN